MAVFSMAGSNPALPTYPLQRSVRLRSSASAYFNRTFSAAPTTFTFSCWVKRGTLGAQQIIAASRLNGVQSAYIVFNASDQISIGLTNGSAFSVIGTSTAVFRDPAAWYHIVFSSTAGGNGILYVNGVQVFSGSVPAGYWLFTNTASWVNAIGRLGDFNGQYFDGYLEEINFIDGQALTPSSFGAYNSYGVWSPAKYTGSYGTNGFYLNFQDNSALTTTANVGIGKDSSGNGNYWTSNNISITAGTTYDSMLDVPTNTSATNANFCTGNPLDNSTTLSNANLTVSATASTGVTGTMALPSTGSLYWETTVTTVAPSGNTIVGILATNQVAGVRNVTAGGIRAYVRSDGLIIIDSTTVQSGLTALSNGDVIGCAYNATTNSLQFYRNNSTYGTAVTLTTGYTYVPWCASAGTSVFNWNFGQRPFTYTPPTGFNRLNTYNLPDSIVPVGAQYMAATTYTGNSSTNSLTNTVNGKSFQPDFVWIKNRTSALSHYLNDSVRGVYQTLFSNSTAAEYNGTSTSDGVSAFNTSGFTVLNGTNAANYNQSANNYVAWQWRASNASAVTNTSGSITSQVSANQTAGFSIVTFTCPASGNFTVGHGLGVVPAMFILKTRNGVDGWYVYHKNLTTPASNYLVLNTSAAIATSTGIWGNTNPTSSVLTLGTNSGIGANLNGLLYCFAAVPGYSAFGGYTGNGSADGPFIYTGFRPRWLMIKKTDTTSDWWIWDTSRNTYNQMQSVLYADLSDAEFTSSVFNFDALSNGFKNRSSNVTVNGSGATYIYAAFAENPFKNSLAR